MTTPTTLTPSALASTVLAPSALTPPAWEAVPFTATLPAATRIPMKDPLERLRQVLHSLMQRVRRHYQDQDGMSTIEYALGCVAAAALGALLYTVVTSDTVEQALSGIFERALNEN